MFYNKPNITIIKNKVQSIWVSDQREKKGTSLKINTELLGSKQKQKILQTIEDNNEASVVQYIHCFVLLIFV